MPGIKPTSKRFLDPNSRQRWLAQLDDHVNSLAWSPDSSLLAAASVSGPITLFSGETGQVRHVLDGHAFGTCEVDWNADGSLLASVGQDGQARIWDLESGQLRFTLPGGAAWVEHLAWSLQGNLLATAAGRKLRLWNAREGKAVQEYPDQRSTISDLQWQPGTQVLTSASYSNVTFWSSDTNEPVRTLEWKGSILALAWSPDSKYIATGDQDATVHFWIVKTGKDLQMYGYPTKVRELSWDGSGRYLATGGSATPIVWDCSGRGPEGTRPIELNGHVAFISALAFQHRGPLIATACQDGKVVFWRVDRPKRPLVQAAFEGEISQLVWSRNDKLVAIGTSTGLITVCTPPQLQ